MLLIRVLKLFDAWFLQMFRVGRIDGVSVCDLVTGEPGRSDFLRSTVEAMNLIREHDLRRYRRVCKYLKCIANRPLISGGEFEQVGGICSVDYDKHYSAGDRDWRLRTYACLLIHEATHGLLAARGIAYNDKSWEQSERLCRLEEYRFIRKIDEWWADEYLSPKRFSPEFWRDYRNAKHRQKAWRERFRELWRGRSEEKKREDREKRYERLKKQGRRLF